MGPVSSPQLYILQNYCLIVCRSNESLIASGGEDDCINVWRLDSGTCIARLQGHRAWLTDIHFFVNSFEDDVLSLLSVADDGFLCSWTVPLQTISKVGECFPDFSAFESSATVGQFRFPFQGAWNRSGRTTSKTGFMYTYQVGKIRYRFVKLFNLIITQIIIILCFHVVSIRLPALLWANTIWWRCVGMAKFRYGPIKALLRLAASSQERRIIETIVSDPQYYRKESL